MRLAHPILSTPIHWEEQDIPVLTVEHPRLFARMVFELSAQAEGEDGEFSLSLDYDPLDAGEHLHVIRDFFLLSLDDRRLQNRFQAYLQMIVRESLPEETQELQERIARYMGQIALEAEYPMAFTGGEYVIPLLKSLKCQLSLDGDSALDRLMQYLSIYNGLMKDQCFVLVGAHSYFTREELAALYRMAQYQKWRILLLEQHQWAPIPGEQQRLVDEDLCELKLDFPDGMV